MISIITSLYKSERYLSGYLKRIKLFSTRAKNISFEVICIANSPSAEEEDLLSKFSDGNKWFRLIVVPRENLYATWNRGVNLALGENICFWHVDDQRFAPAVVEAEDLLNKGSLFVHSPYIYQRNISLGGTSIPVKILLCNPPVYDKNLFTSSMPFGPFFSFSKKLYSAIGQFDEQFKIAGDFDWAIRAAKFTDKFEKTKSLAGIFFNEGKSLSGSRNPRHIAENNVVYARHNIFRKLLQSELEIERQFRLKELLVDGKFIKLSE